MRVKLGNVAVESRETYTGSHSGVPVIGLEHLTPEDVNLTAWNVDSENTFTKRFGKGQVLFGRRRAYLKKAVVAPCDGICSGDITVIAAKPDSLAPELLPFVIQNDRFFDFAVGKSAGSLSPRAKWEHLREFEFELPPLGEQCRLAEALWAFDDTKQAYKRLIKLTDELVKSRFVEMFGEPMSNPKDRNMKCFIETFLEMKCHLSKSSVWVPVPAASRVNLSLNMRYTNSQSDSMWHSRKSRYSPFRGWSWYDSGIFSSATNILSAASSFIISFPRLRNRFTSRFILTVYSGFSIQSSNSDFIMSSTVSKGPVRLRPCRASSIASRSSAFGRLRLTVNGIPSYSTAMDMNILIAVEVSSPKLLNSESASALRLSSTRSCIVAIEINPPCQLNKLYLHFNVLKCICQVLLHAHIVFGNHTRNRAGGKRFPDLRAAALPPDKRLPFAG
jgi:type I restriction enzyme S subunit